MTQGGSIRAAGTYLGNSPTSAATAIYQVNTWARRAGLSANSMLPGPRWPPSWTTTIR
ncbi:hypothetical protein ACQEU3_45750 [Spirillospora sp. CA-253888]